MRYGSWLAFLALCLFGVAPARADESADWQAFYALHKPRCGWWPHRKEGETTMVQKCASPVRRLGRRVAVAGLVVALACCARVRLSSAASQPSGGVGGAPPSGTSDQLLKVLLTGLRVREQLLETVSGEAVVERFLTNTYYRAYEDPRFMEQRRSVNGVTDRDMAVARFALDHDRYRVEAQSLIWAGAMHDWFVPRGYPNRPAYSTGDLHREEACDGDYAYVVLHEAGGEPFWERLDRDNGSVVSARRRLQTWLGVCNYGPRLSEFISDPRWRSVRVQKDALDGQPCFAVRLACLDRGLLETVDCWIAPAKGYAPVKLIRLVQVEQRPSSGGRGVTVWRDHRLCGTVWVPGSVVVDDYQYGRICEGGAVVTGWTGRERINLSDVAQAGTVSTSSDLSTPPVGAVVRLHQGETPPAAILAAAERHRALLDRKSAFLREPFPAADAAWERPLTADDLAATKREYGLP